MSSILTCTDGSLYSTSTYQHAAWAARQLNLPVHVLHVIEREETPHNRDFSGSLGFQANDELLRELSLLDESHARIARLRGTAILQDAASQISTEVTTTQRHGALVDTVAEFEEDAALIVLGKRGEQADFSKAHLGSNLERVIRSAKIPVLVAAREFRPIKRFLIAFDGGQSALHAVNYVASQTLLKGTECHLLSVGKMDTESQRNQDAAAKALQGAGFNVLKENLPGEPEDVIAEKVTQSNIDLLVMGAYGHSRIREFILGSTTTTLIRTCQIPVLLFR